MCALVRKLAVALLLLIAVVALYRKATRLWWTYDDAFYLKVSALRPWTAGFTESDVWPQKLFTPLLTVTYELLAETAGPDPDRWYRVQLALLASCGMAVFLALRLYVRTIPAFAGALLFITGPPLCSFATQLMVVHYLEAVLLGTGAVIAFVVASRRRSTALGMLSAALYFAAMLAKEIAVPLPALLLFLPERTWRDRARHLLFHAAAAGGYLVWRYAMVGTLFGGYGWAIAPQEIPSILAALPWKVITASAGAGLGVGLVALALLAMGGQRAIRSRRALAFALVTLLFAVAPIVPVSKEMQRRYVVMPWLWACVVFVAGADAMRRGPRNALLTAAAAVVIVANRQEWAAEYGRSLRMSEEARAYMRLDSRSMLRLPAVPPAAMTELRWLKEEHFRRARGTLWFYDDLYLCHANLDGFRVFQYVPARRSVVEVTARIPEVARSYCSSIRQDAPLQAEFRHRGESLFWSFGPYERGRWSVLLGGGLQAFDVPRRDGFRLAGVPGLTLRIRYQSPEGWVTYSPELALDFARQPDFAWHR